MKTFSRPLSTCVVLCCECFHDYNGTLPKNSRFLESWNRFGSDFYHCVFRCKHHFLILIVRGLEVFQEQTSERELVQLAFHFAVWNFVFELALFCTFQLITGVYNNQFLSHHRKKRHFLNFSSLQ